jgi:hypothetical protein
MYRRAYQFTTDSRTLHLLHIHRPEILMLEIAARQAGHIKDLACRVVEYAQSYILEKRHLAQKGNSQELIDKLTEQSEDRRTEFA